MPCYVIALPDIKDPTLYDEYRKQVLPTIAAYGGKFIVRGGAMEVVEGNWRPKRLVIVEFPSTERAKAWYHSAEYAPVRAIRQRAAGNDMLFVEGV